MPTTDTAIDHATSPLRTIEPTASLFDAARIMRLEDLGALGVVEAGHLLGMLTERDLVHAIAAGTDPRLDVVAHYMTAPATTARPDDRVLDLALTMLDRWVRHIPIVDELGHPQGMVSLRDVLRPLIVQAMTPPALPTEPRRP